MPRNKCTAYPSSEQKKNTTLDTHTHNSITTRLTNDMTVNIPKEKGIITFHENDEKMVIR